MFHGESATGLANNDVPFHDYNLGLGVALVGRDRLPLKDVADNRRSVLAAVFHKYDVGLTRAEVPAT